MVGIIIESDVILISCPLLPDIWTYISLCDGSQDLISPLSHIDGIRN